MKKAIILAVLIAVLTVAKVHAQTAVGTPVAPFTVTQAATTNQLQGGSVYEGQTIQPASGSMQGSNPQLQGSAPDLQPSVGYKVYN